MFKYLVLACLVFLSSGEKVFALHLHIEEEVHKILLPKEDGLNLETVKKMVVNDGIDVQLSYERLIEAQRKIGVARASYFPYGLGTVSAMYFFNVWNPLILAELVTSLPSKIYHVQAEKNMSRAQAQTLKALKENLKNQVAHLYYAILKEESALKLTELRISLMEDLIQVYRERVELGISNEIDLIELEQNLRKDRDTYLKFSAYMVEVRAAFFSMLQVSPETKMELQPVKEFLSVEDYNLTIPDMIRMTLERSHEMAAADYLVKASYKARRSSQWSILSFGGLGFGYYSSVKLAKHKIQEAKLNRQLVEETLTNQVYTLEEQFKSALKLVESERGIFDRTSFFMNSQLERFKKGHLSLDRLLETQLVYLKDFNEMIQSHYLSLTRLDDLERLIMGGAQSISPDELSIEVHMEEQRRRWKALWVKTPEGVEIEEVRYVFNDELNLRPMKSYAAGNNFGVRIRTYRPERISGTVEVTLSSGQVISRQFNFVQ